ncbi:MAG: hypothetical protein ACE5JX_09290 [Acidobacteriota bacterium]
MKNHILYLMAATLIGLGACGGQTAEEEAAPSGMLRTESEAASLETPVEVAAGAEFEVAWTGPDNQNDYVTIVEKGAPEGTYRDYKYTREGSPLGLVASETPGEFEVRYVAGETKDILVSAPITVTEVEASLDAPGEVGAGARFGASWTGPDNKNDYVTIVEKGAPQGKYGSYTYTRQGSSLELTASEDPGDYEIRYVMAQSKRILASRPIRVTSVEADLTVPSEVMINTPVETTWAGPDNQDDYITIVEAGAPEGTYRNYTYTRQGSPLTVKAPETPGLYEIRYIMARSKRILASAPVTVKPLSSSLEAPSEAAPGASIDVVWTGPNNPADFIAVAKKDSPYDSYESRAYSRAGNPAKLFAPSVPGSYELRYVLASPKTILASIPISIAAPEQ